MSVSPYNCTQEDLEGLDGKTLEGLQPLLDSLNITIPQLVSAAQLAPQEQWVDVTLVTDTAVADSFPLVFKHALTRPQGVFLANITPKDPDHIKTAPFVMQGFSLTDGGLVSVPWITGILASNSYALRFLVR
jgi:hypothetical protein